MMTLIRTAVAALAGVLPMQAIGQAVPPAAPVPPVLATPFYQGVPEGAAIPRVVPELSVPRPLSTNVDPNLTQIRITFDQPMDTALFYWPLPSNDPLFPLVTNNPFWTNNDRTIVLPVRLSPSRAYAIPINTPALVFRGATGLYVNPGLFRFETSPIGGAGGSVSGNSAAAGPRFQRGGTGFLPNPTAVPGVPFGSAGVNGAGRTPVPTPANIGGNTGRSGGGPTSPSSGSPGGASRGPTNLNRFGGGTVQPGSMMPSRGRRPAATATPTPGLRR